MDIRRMLVIIIVILVILIGIFMIFCDKNNVIKLEDSAKSNNHTDIWKTVNSNIVRGNNSTEITRGADEKWFYLFLNPERTESNYIYNVPFTVEFDVTNNTYRSQIEFRDELNNAVSNFEFNSLPNRGLGHWKINVESNSQKYYYNGDLIKTDNHTFTDKIRVGFVGIYFNDTDETTLSFSNFKFTSGD